MHIVYLNKVKIDSKLPAVNFTVFNAYGLAQAGAQITLIVQKSDECFSETDLYDNFRLTSLKNLTIKILKQKRKFGIRSNQWFYIEAFGLIKKIDNENRIDAVISRDPGALPYLVRLKKKRSTSVFYQPHNFYVDLSLRHDVNPTNAKKYHLLEKKYIPKISGLLCLQESQASLFKKYFPGQLIFAAKPGLIKMGKVNNKKRFENKLIGYIGSLQPKKGVDILLKAFKQLKNEGYKLVLIGGRNKDEIESIQREIELLGLREYVEITGWLPYVQVEKYLQNISVGVLPLKDTFYNRYLTAPNKLFDYLSHGIPILSSDLPAIRDFICDGKEGLLFNPEKHDDLKNKLIMICKTHSSYIKYSQGSLETSEKYLWSVRADYMLTLIREILDR